MIKTLQNNSQAIKSNFKIKNKCKAQNKILTQDLVNNIINLASF